MLALTASVVAGYRWWNLEPPVLIVNDHFSRHEAFEAQTIKLIEPIGGGKFEVTLELFTWPFSGTYPSMCLQSVYG
jgi:hypothetical protein